MKAVEAPVLARIEYGRVEYGFMRDPDGSIFFLSTTSGGDTIHHTVFEDGSIARAAEIGDPEKLVEMIHPRALGISGIRWAQ